MPELPPPPAVDDRAAEAGWYPDPQADILRWWDGEAWSETDVTLPGAAGYPWWHQDGWRERFGPFSRAGSLFNVAFCGMLLVGSLSLPGASTHAFRIIPVILEAAFIVIAVRAWWPRGTR